MKPISIVLLLTLHVSLLGNSDSAKFPEILKIKRPYTPEFIDLGHITTADSAVFRQPQPRVVLNSRSTTVEIFPRCQIDSMTLFVRHSYSKVDTIAHLHRPPALARMRLPPWRTKWNYADIPDQDQIHLQFGYRIYQPGGKIITSPALPHQWMIDRRIKRNPIKYRCAQIVKPDTIIIDGKSDEWKRVKRATIDSGGTFALCWTSATVLMPATLYLIAEIHTRNVLPTDIVELHLDPYRTRTSFASEKHRSILFAPTGRSYCFTSDSTGANSFRQSDSIAALFNDVVTWRSTVHDSGYIVEAAIPFYTLSEMKYPPRRAGFDLTIRSGSQPFHFAGWANNHEYTRYSPARWGTIIFSQRTLPLTVIVLLGALIIILIAVTLTVTVIRNSAISRNINRKEATGDSSELRRIREYVDSNLSDANLSIETAAIWTGLPADRVALVLQIERDATFERFIRFSRICAAKRMFADFGLPLDTIARECGFGTVDEMTGCFRDYLHADPEELRERLRETSSDDEDESAPRSRSGGPVPGTDAPTT